MADRIPLIVDSSSNQVKELPAGDNLDLGNAGLTNVGSVNATDVTINGVSFNNPFSEYSARRKKCALSFDPLLSSER